jgi:hypothetical protein
MREYGREIGATMDPVVAGQLAGVLSRLADGALGEAGRDAWLALVRLVTRVRKPDREASPGAAPDAALTELEARPGDEARAATASHAVARLAAADTEFAAIFGEWWASVERLVSEDDSPGLNVIQGNVHGHVVQARDVYGGISFGSSQSPA